VLQQQKMDRKVALEQRKAERMVISRELKQMRQEEAATRALLQRRRGVEAAARKQMSMEDVDTGGLTLKA
jgi:membrane protein involved in colicin uptake